MGIPGWKAVGPGRGQSQVGWLKTLEPLTTGLLAQENLKLWAAGDRAAVGIRAGAVVYPVFPGPGDPELDDGIRTILDRVGDSWCLLGPSPWVSRAEPLMPDSKILHRVPYDFLVRPARSFTLYPGPGTARAAGPSDTDVLFGLQEAYEKEEVLFDTSEFQPLASRLHFSKALREQFVEALWIDGEPVAKAGTNALTDQWAQLGGVFTRPDRRGQGLQKRLLSSLLGHLADQGRGACLFVKKSNSRALGLYKTLGFEAQGEFTIIYGERQVWGRVFR